MSEQNQQQRLEADIGARAQQPQSAEHEGATDLTQVLNAVTEIMAESERRQSAALTDMQQRIAEISSNAVTARDDVPVQHHNAFQRIEDAMSHLAQRISAGPAPAGYPAAESTQDGVSHNANDTSAALKSLAKLLGSDINRPVPVTLPSDEAGHGPTPDSAGNPDEPWDEATAEQLTQLYESGEAGLPPLQAAAEPATVVHSPAAAADSGPDTAAAEPAPQATERHWMADQFTKLAAQIEHSLSQSGKTEISLEAVAQRLAELESRFDHALEQLVTRSDVSSLRDIEACIVELTAQFENSQAELARVQGIEWQVQSLASRLSEERVSAMTDAVTSSQDQPDFAALAEAIGQQIAEQSSANSVDAQSETAERTATELSDVKGLLNNLIAEQRSEGKETIDRLETMQQAMVALLERVEKFESVEQPAPLPQLAQPHAHHEIGSFPHDGPMLGEPEKTAPAPIDAPSLETIAELPPHSAPTPAAPHAPMELKAELATSPEVQEPYSDDQPMPTPAVDRTDTPPKPDRQNFMAEARRAAAKANARAEVQPGSNDDDSQPRSRKSQGAKANDSDGESQPRASRIRLLVAAVAVIAIGISATNLLVGVPLLSFGGQAPAAKSVPAPKPAPAQPTPAAPANPTTGSNQNGATPIAPDAPRATADVPPALSTKPQLAARPSPVSLNQPSAGLNRPANGSAGVSTRLSRDLPPALVGPLSLRLAAANGNPSAMFEVGTRFAEGRGIEQDFKQAIKWYTRAATKSFALAQYRLAALYERGLGGAKDLARAKIWYERAARQGNVKSMHNLAVLTAGSRVGSADYATAAQWFTKAAERGLTDSQFNLAILYENGLGVSKDMTKAYHWFGIAARSGDKDAKKRQQSLRAKIGEQSARTADAAIANWRHRVTNRMANDARYAGSQWQQQQKAGKTNG